MTHPAVDLRLFNNSWYQPGRPWLMQAVWFLVALPVFRSAVVPGSKFRAFLLRLFGARVGTGVVIKPGCRVKYPWRLQLGDHCWLGEDAWIDNLHDVILGRSVCLSQGAYLCTGNHDWTDPAFGLIVKPIVLKDFAWVAAKAVICPGVCLQEGAVAGAGSVITRDIPAWEVHVGNPATLAAKRVLKRGTTR